MKKVFESKDAAFSSLKFELIRGFVQFLVAENDKDSNKLDSGIFIGY